MGASINQFNVTVLEHVRETFGEVHPDIGGGVDPQGHQNGRSVLFPGVERASQGVVPRPRCRSTRRCRTPPLRKEQSDPSAKDHIYLKTMTSLTSYAILRL